MKSKLIFCLLISVACLGRSESSFEKASALAPEALVRPLYNAYHKMGGNQSAFAVVIEACKSDEERACVFFLLSWMPERDLLTFKVDKLLSDVRWALKAKHSLKYMNEVPNAIFLNDVLPSYFMNETRDDWRGLLYKTFYPLVKDCKTVREAALVVNYNIERLTKVQYSTKRDKADQSALESIKSKMASCSGLSILLSSAFRAVGIPSRLAGVPLWADESGNHTWNEVWFENRWQFTEYYPDQKGMNHGWLLAKAIKADSTNWLNRIYATSYQPTTLFFPLVWDYTIRYVYGVDVTQFYIDLAKSQLKKSDTDREVTVDLVDKLSGKRLKKMVKILQKDQVLFMGKTKGPLADLNNHLIFYLRSGESYVLTYSGKGGKRVSHVLKVQKEDEVQHLQIEL